MPRASCSHRVARLGICPEGVSHDEPRLRPIKTGAARIAIAAVSTGEVSDLKIVPAGLYYTSKTKFRSAVLLYFGKPIEVEPVELEPDGNPPRAEVRELSNKIECALRAVMLDAEHEEALQTISRAERIFSSEPREEGNESLAQELQLQQRFIKAYRVLCERAPERLRKLEVRMSRFEEELTQAGVDPDDLSPPTSTLDVFKHLDYASLSVSCADPAGNTRRAGPLSRLPTRRLHCHEVFEVTTMTWFQQLRSSRRCCCFR